MFIKNNIFKIIFLSFFIFFLFSCEPNESTLLSKKDICFNIDCLSNQECREVGDKGVCVDICTSDSDCNNGTCHTQSKTCVCNEGLHSIAGGCYPFNKIYQFGTSGVDYSYGMKIDKNDNIYTYGVKSNNENQEDFVIKFDKDMNLIYEKNLTISNKKMKYISDIAFDYSYDYYYVALSEEDDGFEYSSILTFALDGKLEKKEKLFFLTKGESSRKITTKKEDADLNVNLRIKGLSSDNNSVYILGSNWLAKTFRSDFPPNLNLNPDSEDYEPFILDKKFKYGEKIRYYREGDKDYTCVLYSGSTSYGVKIYEDLENEKNIDFGELIPQDIIFDKRGNLYTIGLKSDEYYSNIWVSKTNYKEDKMENLIFAENVNVGDIHITTDNNNHIYIVASVEGDFKGLEKVGKKDILLIKIDSSADFTNLTPDSDKVTVKLIGTEKDDTPDGILIDTQSNIWIVGDTEGSFTKDYINKGNSDIFLMKIEQ